MAITQEQKDSIKILRLEHWGYKRISKELDLSHDQVRDYCRTNKGMLAGRMALPVVKKTRECAVCGEAYVWSDEWHNVKCCSEDCVAILKERKAEERVIKRLVVCSTCGLVFERTGSRQVYCSERCRYETVPCKVCGKPFVKKRCFATESCSPKCGSAALKLSHEEYYVKFSNIHKGKIVPITKYTLTTEPMTVYCLDCQKTTTANAEKFIDSAKPRSCSYCKRTRSTGEEVVAQWLDNNGKKYRREFMDDELFNEKPLRFDFAVLGDDDEVVALIEYNGRQHYEPVEQFGGEVSFQRQKDNDMAKRQYALSKSIELIEINHKDKYRIKEILNTKLN